MTRQKKSKSYQEELIKGLRDPEEAVAYLNSALDENELDLFLMALRNVAEAKGMSKVARETHLNRENLYRMLSSNGNPQLSSLTTLLDALGFQLVIDFKKAA
ncbi:MAG: putative addiction module antidote protein [Deltaproteobacteria bacterium RIFCSPHIGHO2_12_FULL_43_9]|nr:MAG: putative addiction module antidote protein [Deltaproteobacteria bacterium RIFCSPHIGHO2_12_FULL_43_9]